MTIKYSRFLQCIVLSVILAGCQSTPTDSEKQQLSVNEQLEQLLKDSYSENKYTATAAAIQAALLTRELQPDIARKLINNIDPSLLNLQQHGIYLLVKNTLSFNNGDFEQVISRASDKNNLIYQSSLTPEQHITFSMLTANSYALSGQLLNAAKTRIDLSNILSPDQTKENNNAIWQILTQTPSQKLNTISASDSILSGWIDLVKVARATNDDITTQLSLLSLWQQRWPLHPANQALPGGLAMLKDIEALRPKNIAMIVPLSGKLQKAGESVRDGFMAAYYHNKRTQQDTVIDIYDSQAGDIKTLYDQAVTAGAELVIGPLSKQNVSELASYQLTVPILSLNYSNTPPADNRFYQLSLATSDEISLITQQAHLADLQRIILLYPEGKWGESIAAEYTQQWTALGGEIIANASYTNEQSMSPSLKKALHIDLSQQRSKKIKEIIDLPFKTDPYRRLDVDGVFVVAKSQQGRSVKPLLAFYYAKDLPVYATSNIYNGITNPSKDRDSDGIMFPELPWILKKSPLHKQIEQYIEQGGNYSKSLYALGIDAYAAAPRLSQLKVQPQSRIYGETGTLKMQNNGVISRQPSWAIFKRGKAVQASTLEAPTSPL